MHWRQHRLMHASAPCGLGDWATSWLGTGTTGCNAMQMQLGALNQFMVENLGAKRARPEVKGYAPNQWSP